MRTEIVEKTHRAEKRSFQFADLLYLRADSKYVEAHHVNGMLVLDESLASLEREFGEKLLRIHRGTLVARSKALEVERHGEHYYLHVDGVIGTLRVSRRYAAMVRKELHG